MTMMMHDDDFFLTTIEELSYDDAIKLMTQERVIEFCEKMKMMDDRYLDQCDIVAGALVALGAVTESFHVTEKLAEYPQVVRNFASAMGVVSDA